MAEQDVLNLEYFRAGPVWAFKQGGHPMKDSLLCFHISLLSQYVLWEHKPRPEEPQRFWDLYPLGSYIQLELVNFHSTPLPCHYMSLLRQRRNRRRTQKAFKYCPPHWVWKSAWGISDQDVSCTSFPSAFVNFNAPLLLALIFLQRDEFWTLVVMFVLLYLMLCLSEQLLTTLLVREKWH